MSTDKYIIDTLPIATKTKPRGSEETVVNTAGYIAIARKVGTNGKPTGLVQLDVSCKGSPELFSVSKWAACFKHAKATFPNADVDKALVDKAIEADFEEKVNALASAGVSIIPSPSKIASTLSDLIT